MLGVYPSALHVRWRLPAWAVRALGLPPAVAALAVDDEPTVFWDGGSTSAQEALVRGWCERVQFIDGDDEDCDGFARPSGNGSSGRAVLADVLEPLAVPPPTVWFTDAVPEFHVKYAAGSARQQQGDRLRDVYAPFAAARGREAASLPARPTPARLVERAVASERSRLLEELASAQAPVVVTLGEEARQVLARLAGEATGPPSVPLHPDTQGRPGTATVEGNNMTWLALTHPGNASARWADARARFRRSPPRL